MCRLKSAIILSVCLRIELLTLLYLGLLLSATGRGSKVAETDARVIAELPALADMGGGFKLLSHGHNADVYI